MSFTVVDFPEPLGPSNPKTSPRRTSKSTPSTARALGRPQKSLKTLVRPRTTTTESAVEVEAEREAEGDELAFEASAGAGMAVEERLIFGRCDGDKKRKTEAIMWY